MSTRNHDYANDARNILGESRIEDLGPGDIDLSEALAFAQVQATLALVEEQRTANLIAALTVGFWLGYDYEDEAWADEVMPRLHLRGESR